LDFFVVQGGHFIGRRNEIVHAVGKAAARAEVRRLAGRHHVRLNKKSYGLVEGLRPVYGYLR
jgi:hypothetical protein